VAWRSRGGAFSSAGSQRLLRTAADARRGARLRSGASGWQRAGGRSDATGRPAFGVFKAAHAARQRGARGARGAAQRARRRAARARMARSHAPRDARQRRVAVRKEAAGDGAHGAALCGAAQPAVAVAQVLRAVRRAAEQVPEHVHHGARGRAARRRGRQRRHGSRQRGRATRGAQSTRAAALRCAPRAARAPDASGAGGGAHARRGEGPPQKCERPASSSRGPPAQVRPSPSR
jgi:hypothetical protein